MDITITVPLTKSDLLEAATKLTEMAKGITSVVPGMPTKATKDIDAVLSELTPPTSVPTVPMPPAIAPPVVPPPPSASTAPQFPGSAPATTAPPTPPAVAPPAPPATPEAVELDSEGLPWDERIHSSSRKKYAKDNKQTGTKAGGWKRARSVQPLTVDQVKAELRLKYPDSAPTLPAAPILPAVPAAPASAPVVPPVSPDTDAYTPLMQKCTARISANELALEDIMTICTKHGLSNIPELAGRPDLIPVIDMELEALWTQNTQG